MKEFMILSSLALGANFLFYVIMHLGMHDCVIKRLYNRLTCVRGETEKAAPVTDAKFTQEDINRFVAAERKELEKKYGDYKDLRTFKEQHESEQEKLKQAQLEAAGKFEEAKKGYEGKITEYSSKLSEKDRQIQQLHIGYAIQGEVVRQNAYPDAADLLKSLAVVQEDGSVKIKGKDANGIDTLLDVTTGVSQFLKSKPYLVKASGQGGAGSGTGTGGTGPGSSGGVPDRIKLQNELAQAMSTGNHKKVAELSKQIREAQMGRGVTGVI